MIQLYQTLDLRPIGIPQTLRLSQYDSDFEIIFELTNFDGAWILDTNTTAEVQGTKTDGHGYSADAVFDDQLKTVTIAGDVQMTAAAGRNVYEVVLFHDGDRLGSKNFILDVERAALDAETTASDSKIKNFTEMVESAEQAAETATAAAEAAEESAASVPELKNALTHYPDSVNAGAGVFPAVFFGGYWRTGAVGASLTHTDSASYVSTLIPVVEGDTVTLDCNGSTGYSRLYAFANSNMVIVKQGSTNLTGKRTLTAPANAAFLAVNNSLTSKPDGYYAYKGTGIQAQLGDVNDDIGFIFDVATESFINFVAKNINATTGELSNSSTSICNDVFLNIDDIYKLGADASIPIRFYLYDASEAFIHNTDSYSSLVTYKDIQGIKETYPSAVYARVKFGESANPVTLDDYAENGVYVLVWETASEVAGEINYDRIAEYGEDHVFTQSFTLTLPFDNYANNVFSCVAKYEQDNTTEFPTVSFSIGSGLAKSCPYTIGELGQYATKEWRVTRPEGNTKGLVLTFTIPTGVTVYIKDFYARQDTSVNRVPSGLRINGHRRFAGLTPQDSLPGVEAGAKAGLTAFIEIPKRTSDGVWICYHDDTLKYDDTYIRQADGSQLPSTYNGTAWSNISYANEANTWDWGISFGAYYAGLKPLRLDAFFAICAKTGMYPMLSLHPTPSAAEMREIKALAKKYGVLKNLGLKTTVTSISTVYSVFGNDIESYTVDVSSGSQTETVINAAISAINGLSGCTVRKVIELFASTAYNAYFGGSPYTPFELISEAGLECSICQQTGQYNPTNSSNTVIMWGSDMMWWAANHGVTEFTTEYNWSTGLNW